MSEDTPTPRIDIEISFDRSTHSYSQETSPPKITLKVTSRAETPITIFTWRKPLDPKGALTSEGYVITDNTTDQRVKTTKVMINRAAIRRVRGGLDEQFFLELMPNEAVELSTGMRCLSMNGDLASIFRKRKEYMTNPTRLWLRPLR